MPILLALVLGLPLPALAQSSSPPAPVYRTCPAVDALPANTSRLSVVWISPLRRKAFPATKLTVLPTRTLRAWIEEHNADLPRLLAGLGLRKPQRRIRRPWKAVIFEVEIDQLCRPTDGEAPGQRMDDGALVCPHGARRIAGRDDSCGQLVDLVNARPTLPAFHVRWKDASTRGFCVLPLERFVRGE